MELMTRFEAIDYLRISERQMCELTREKALPYIQSKPGGRIMFLKEDLDAYIMSKRITKPDPAKLSLLGGTYRKRRSVV